MESKVQYGQEHGKNLQKIGMKLLKNQNLLKLLVNTDLEPLNPKTHPDNINGFDLLNKNIKFVPLMLIDDQKTTSKVVLLFDSGDVTSANEDNETISLIINVYCPFEEWLIAGDDLRPFAIMSEIRKSLQNKRLNGLGEIRYEGFSVATLTEEMGAYSMRFMINAFS